MAKTEAVPTTILIKHNFRLKVYRNNKKSFFLIMKEHFLPYLAEWERVSQS